MVKYNIKCKTAKDVANLSALLGQFDKKRLQKLINHSDNSVTIVLKDISQKTGNYILDRSDKNEV